MKNEPHKIHRQARQHPKKLRLGVEKLECRRLLAGLNVSVTIDTSLAGNLQSDVGLPAANRILYVDLNRNGWFEPTEPVAITNEAGRAFFEGLEAGDYSIRLLTDNYHQRQVSPAVVETTNELEVPLPSRWLIGGIEPGQSLWGLTSDGILTLVSANREGQNQAGGPASNASILAIGGQPVSVAQRTPTEAWISYRTANQSKLAVFNSVSKQLTSYYVSGSENLVDLATDGESMFGVVKAVSQADVVRLELNPQGLAMTEIIAGQLREMEALGNKLVVIRQAGASKFLDLVDYSGKRLSSTPLPASAGQLQVDKLTGSIVVDSTDGLMVFRAPNNTLAQVALIAEATAPIAMSSGRMIATDRSHRGELTVWNMTNWSPVGHLSVGDVDIRDVRSTDLKALVLADEVVHLLDLAAARPFEVRLSGQQDQNVSFSVHQLTAAPALSVPAPPVRSIAENQPEMVDLRQIMTDANGQFLWFSIVSHPLHGTVQLTHNGLLEFTPEENFFGGDSVTIRVHDGISSADVSLNWNIVEANRPPVAMNVSIGDVLEGLPAGTAIGTVSVIDPNEHDTYQITSADARFRVENGKVILNEPLDFEAGASIVLDLTAIDALGQFSISSSTLIRIINVVEAPEGVVLSEHSIPENVSGVLVGKLFVVPSDAAGDYEVSVDDPRFEVRGDELWLLDPLNYEQASSVKLNFVIKDRNDPNLVVTSSTTLTVIDQDDKPTGIVLSSSQVAEQTPGAEVGLISVVDEDGNEVGGEYRYSVSDERFVVTDGVLRLVADVTLDRNLAASIPITVAATSASGGIIVVTFPLTVVPPRSPWQNPRNPLDVNGDGRVTPSDPLRIIDFLNTHGPGQVPEIDPTGSGENPIFLDVNGDGRITPIDALILINFLNDRAVNAGGASGGNRMAGEGESPTAPAIVEMTAWNTEEERRKINSRIDAELEQLLDQLAQDSLHDNDY